MRNIKTIFGAVAAFGLLAVSKIASAHEAYVLTSNQFHYGLNDESIHVFDSLRNPHNLMLFFVIALGIGIAFALSIWFRNSKIGSVVHRQFERASGIGPLAVRLSVGISFLVGAVTNSFLGPELPLSALPWAMAIRGILFIAGVFIILGLFTRAATLLMAIVFITAASYDHWYVLTYFNYVGEIIALLLFGSGRLSLDYKLFGATKWLVRWRKFEPLVIRACYGFALLFAAIDIKMIHSGLTYQVVTHYNLTRFHLLFPSDALFVVLGAGLAEIAIGLFILIGFELRLTVLISLFYLTLSLLFFREAVWPHLILYGISIYLLVTPERYAVDNWVSTKLKRTAL